MDMWQRSLLCDRDRLSLYFGQTSSKMFLKIVNILDLVDSAASKREGKQDYAAGISATREARTEQVQTTYRERVCIIHSHTTSSLAQTLI